MATNAEQFILDDPDNLLVPHGVVAQFDQNSLGVFRSLGTFELNSLNLNPRFAEHFSNNHGPRVLQRRILVERSLTGEMTLFEPNIANLQRVFYGSTIRSNQDGVAFRESRVMTLKQVTGIGTDAATLGVDFSK